MGLLQQGASLLLGTNASSYIQPQGGAQVLPNLVLQERHHDAVEVTEQPVEFGAAITDHSFRVPSRLLLTYGYSNASYIGAGSDFSNFSLSNLAHDLTQFGEGYVSEVYEKLFNTMEARYICEVVTTKRVYNNMIITDLETETDDKTAYSMIINIEMREILRVSLSDMASVSVVSSGMKSLTSAIGNVTIP